MEHRNLGVRRRAWERKYRVILLVTDGLAAVVAASVVHGAYGRWAVALGLPPAWIAAMCAYRAYDRSALGLGTEEYRRVLRGALALPALAALAYLWLVHDSELLHDMMMAAAPAAVIALAARWVLRHRLHRRWSRGRDRNGTVLVGPSRSVVELLAVLNRGGAQDLRVAGVCLTDPVNAPLVSELGVTVRGGLGDVSGVVRATGSTAVLVLPAPEIDASVLRRLSWIAAAQAADFLVAPVLADMDASRLVTRPVNGVPLMYVRAPRLSRLPRLPKELLDRSLATALLLLLAPLLLAVALMVRLDSAGPVFFRQRRVGRYGDHFTMYKFRTMREDAEAFREELAHLNENSDGLLFKVKKDPRVTRVGSALRRYSLDELPQLLNVAGGRMSLVGPRPSLPEEVEAYTQEVKRRLLVKPGLTGLWQVSGRSDLPWDEAVRLDLGYVDNWSVGLDLSILMRTAPAVVRGTGAY
ncbi:exopolysaccharide biosynthesis polyprenyl glycosylphosphotransferase [Streptacidiphilus sp. EB129]|uniref:exopolysaccharide biosynthesis polyprenyl glycosylphosphotransferase n=1 Tax=Streptacidiphilus sp. EB129 TaxID=3156262 RepID=UPI003519BBEB